MTERIKISYANCYLISGEGGAVLVDTCNYKDGGKIFARVKDRNVRLIVLTHGHFDHVSSAAYLAKRLKVPVAMSEGDLHLLGNGRLSRLYGHTLLGGLFALCSQPVLKRATYSAFKPELLLRDGDRLDEYGVKARVVALPGHTKGSIDVLTDDGDFIVGDAMFNMLRKTGSRLYENRREMTQSVSRIRKSGAKTLYVGHGKPIKNG